MSEGDWKTACEDCPKKDARIAELEAALNIACRWLSARQDHTDGTAVWREKVMQELKEQGDE